jgi:hypothetical protein
MGGALEECEHFMAKIPSNNIESFLIVCAKQENNVPSKFWPYKVLLPQV